MPWLKEQFQRVKHLIFRGRFEEDLAEEMRLHLDLRTAQQPGSERDARIRFGNSTRIQEQSREAWRWPTLDSVIQDVRYGIRSLAASPAFTITAIVSLTLGIGANTAIFSLLNAIMLRTLPVKDPSALMNVGFNEGRYFTNPQWEALRDSRTPFDGALAYGDAQFDLSPGGERHIANGLMVSGEYFRTLGVPALRGRLIGAEDDKHGCGSAGPVAVISHRFWKNHFDSDPSIVGRTLTLDRVTFPVIGVTPAWFTGLSKDQQFDIAVPLGCEPRFKTDQSALNQRSWWWLRIVGRLKPDVTLQNATAQMRALSPEIMRQTVPNWKPDMQKNYLARTLGVEPAATGFSGLGRAYGTALFTLQAVVAIVLLIACANVANLLLARATARQRELTVRLAIGAGRGRIIRQLLTESLLLAATGAIGGLILASWGTKLLIHMLGAKGATVELDASADSMVIAFTLGTVVLTTLLFGLLPALRASSTAPNEVLKEHGRGSVAGSHRLTLAKALVAVQIGLALTLLSAAALFGESFRRILTVDSGFNAHNVAFIEVEVPQALLAKTDRLRVFEEALQRLRQVPGVLSASRSELTPISNRVWNQDVFAEGYQSKNLEEERLVYLNSLSSGYFQTMGAKLIAGRDFDARDSITAPRVMIIGEATARAFWGLESPLGRKVQMDGPDPNGPRPSYQIIGVVKDMKYESLSEKPLKTGFVPSIQDANPRNHTVFELRVATIDSMSQVLPLARAALVETNKNFSLDFQTFDSQISDSLIQPRLIAAVSGFFGAAGLILAVTGLFGVIAYSTARRRAEIGLRMALGASYSNVLWLVLRDTGLTLIIGAALGLTAAHFAGALVKSLVFGVQPTDPAIMATALCALMIAAAVAAYIPARRAARLDPMESLRIE
jgi:putative ABC transport system permease protein